MMEVKELLQLEWRHLTKEEIGEMPGDVVGKFIPKYYCTEEHVEAFFRWIISNVSRKFEISKDATEELLVQENEIFFIMKKRFFKENASLKRNGVEIGLLLSHLLVPEMSKVDKVLWYYKRLSPKQKKEFKERI